MRFHKNEKSNTHRLYEWISTLKIGDEFSMLDIPDGTCESKTNAAASLVHFEKHGTIKSVFKLRYADKMNRFRYTRVYRFVKEHEGSFKKRPAITCRHKVKTRKYGKHTLEMLPEDPKSLPKSFKGRSGLSELARTFVSLAIKVETLTQENKELKRLLNEKTR